jgi:HTH-type transcriptional regulator/antitoxin HigA
MQIDLKIDSDEYNELDLLTILVEKYEEKNYPIDLPDPVEAIKFRLEQLNLDTTALANILGSKSRASEILNRKRKLSISMIRTLHDKLKIPASSLIADY